MDGNNPPVSSFPPVEIEKDAAHKNSKCGSPSTSSGESGSSSSGSCYRTCVSCGFDCRTVFSFCILEHEMIICLKWIAV